EALFGLAADVLPLRRDRIDLVDEDDRRLAALGLFEYLAQAFLALAIGGAHDLGPVDDEKFRVAFVGDRLGEPGLARSGRTVQQHALGRVDAEASEQFGV